SGAGSALRRPLPCWRAPGDPAGVADGMIAGNRPDALPGPISELDTPLRFGIGPSGSGDSEGPADLDAPAEAAVTVTVSAADGGVHFAEPTMLAVAVSLTEVTEV